MNRTAVVCTSIVTLGVVAALTAGPLTPPPGVVASTYKTLQQVEPRIDVATLPSGGQGVRRISASGSYYLTANVVQNSPTGGSDFHGVVIDADNVTLDLNGFTIDNIGTVSSSGAGVFVNGTRSRVTIRNGTITNFLAGVGAEDDDSVRVENITTGVVGALGIGVGTNSIVSGCAVTSGFNSGIEVGAGSEVSRCVVRSVTQAAYRLGAGARATECAARSSGAEGFVLADGASVAQCTVSEPGGTGILTSNNASVLDCTVRGGPIGVDLNGGGCRVERCKIGNATVGIRSQLANTIVGNTLNAAASLTGEGIVLIAQDNVIEANHIYSFNVAVRIDNSFNVVVRNRFHFVLTPVGGTGAAGSMVAATVTTAAALAADHSANTRQ
ncbi:MAG: hypothetical protein ACKVW3_08355 [Phycisphaerales bacterium]